MCDGQVVATSECSDTYNACMTHDDCGIHNVAVDQTWGYDPRTRD